MAAAASTLQPPGFISDSCIITGTSEEAQLWKGSVDKSSDLSSCYLPAMGLCEHLDSCAPIASAQPNRLWLPSYMGGALLPPRLL